MRPQKHQRCTKCDRWKIRVQVVAEIRYGAGYCQYFTFCPTCANRKHEEFSGLLQNQFKEFREGAAKMFERELAQ